MKKYILVTIALMVGTGLGGCGNEEGDPLGDQGDSNNTSGPISTEEFPNELLEENFETIYYQTSEAFQDAVSLEDFIGMGSDFNAGVTEYELISEIPVQGLTEYQWLSGGGDKGIRSYFADDLTIEGLQLTPLSSHPESDAVYTKNSYQMPISTSDEWFVFWGGTNELVNYHYAVESQRYAFDLLMYDGNTSFEGDPTENDSYFAFGEDVVAPFEGIVVSVENEIDDNTPTVDTNVEEPLGNHVIIEHDNNEYSIIAHFKKGSVKVSEGDEVNSGDLLGLAGNSGNSSEPHIHFHVADGVEWETATAIRIKFMDGADPVRGDYVTGVN